MRTRSWNTALPVPTATFKECLTHTHTQTHTPPPTATTKPICPLYRVFPLDGLLNMQAATPPPPYIPPDKSPPSRIKPSRLVGKSPAIIDTLLHLVCVVFVRSLWYRFTSGWELSRHRCQPLKLSACTSTDVETTTLVQKRLAFRLKCSERDNDESTRCD